MYNAKLLALYKTAMSRDESQEMSANSSKLYRLVQDLRVATGKVYCKRGHFRATFIFALFTLQPGCAKIKAREYDQFVLRSM